MSMHRLIRQPTLVGSLAAAAAVVLMLSACGPRANGNDAVSQDSADVAVATDAAEPVVRLQRETCYGRCPAYVVELFDDGTVRFEGRQHTPVTGVQQSQVDAAEVRALKQRFDDAGFASADSAYGFESANCGQYFADGPQFTLSARIGAQRTRVHVDAGCTAAPRFLSELAAATDSVARSQRWTQPDGVPQ